MAFLHAATSLLVKICSRFVLSGNPSITSSLRTSTNHWTHYTSGLHLPAKQIAGGAEQKYGLFVTGRQGRSQSFHLAVPTHSQCAKGKSNEGMQFEPLKCFVSNTDAGCTFRAAQATHFGDRLATSDSARVNARVCTWVNVHFRVGTVSVCGLGSE
eukprot:1194531-Prorocentrum_minimum.AAC.2